MKRFSYIVLAITLLFSVRVVAQGTGNVVVHADPRLSLVLKKERAVVREAEIRMRHKAEVHAMMHTADAHLPENMTKPEASASVLPVHAAPSENKTTDTKPVVAEPVHAAKEAPRPVARVPIHIREKDGRVIYAGKGYRVQIYSGPDRDKAIAIKTEFMRQFPAVRTYLTYLSPNFRVKVGNYRNRSDAMGMLRQANSINGPCVIVPDIITINSL